MCIEMHPKIMEDFNYGLNLGSTICALSSCLKRKKNQKYCVKMREKTVVSALKSHKGIKDPNLNYINCQNALKRLKLLSNGWI